MLRPRPALLHNRTSVESVLGSRRPPCQFGSRRDSTMFFTAWVLSNVCEPHGGIADSPKFREPTEPRRSRAWMPGIPEPVSFRLLPCHVADAVIR